MELFSLGTATPAGGELHGSAALLGTAQAGGSLRRGFDLSAEVELQANVAGGLGDRLSASLDAGVGARAGVALQAGFPLDLFSEAGLVARLRAQAEVAGFVRATLAMELDEFRNLVRDGVPGVMGRLLEIFFEESSVEAGLWARAAFAAEVLGEASLAGTLVSSAGREAGFTFSARYGAGFGYGAGMDFVVNLALKDPRRLLDRLADELTAVVLSDAQSLVEDPDAPPQAAAAMGAARILIPAAMRTYMHLGFALANAATEEQRAAATVAVVESFASAAQEIVLRSIFDLAADLVAEGLAAEGVLDALVDLEDANRPEVTGALTSLAARLSELEDLDFADVEGWLAAMLSCISAADAVLALGIVPAVNTSAVRRGLALMWASGTLANRAARWLRDPSRAATDLFGTAPASVADNSSTAAYVAQELNKPAGTGLTFTDLVSFLLGEDPIEELKERVPGLEDIIGWLETALASPAGGLLQQLLMELSAPDELDVEDYFERLATACAGAVSQRIVPDLLDPLKQRDPDNEAIALVIDELVVPTLYGLPMVVIPRLPELGDPDVALRLREGLSAIVLQSLQRFVIAAVDVLLERAMTEGEVAVRNAGELIGDLDEQAPGFSTLAMAASQSAFGISLTPQDVVGLLELVADSMHLWNEEQREPLLEALGVVVSLGLATEDTRAVTLATLTDGDEAPSAQALDALLDRVADGVWSMVQLIGPRVLELLALHYLNQARAIAETIYEGAKAIVAAVEEGIEWLGQQAAALQRLVGELAARVAGLMAKALGDIRALTVHLTTLIEDVLEAIRAFGASLAEPLLDPFPEFVKDALMNLYNGLFDAVKALITAPLKVLSAIAGWAEAALLAGIQAGTVSEQQVREAVSNGIHGALAGALTFDLKVSLGSIPIPFDGEVPIEFNAGTVTIPGGEVLRSVAEAVLGDAVFTQTVKTAAADALTAQGVEAQRRNAQAALDGALTQQQANQVAEDLVVDAPLSVTILSPEPEGVYEQHAPLSIRISGANRTFVQTTLGVPPRVEIRVNGRLCTSEAGQWSEVAGGIETSLQIAPIPLPATWATRPAPPIAIRRQVEHTTSITAILSEDGSSVEFNRPGESAATMESRLFEPERASVRTLIGAGDGTGRFLVDDPSRVLMSGEVRVEIDPQPVPDVTLLSPLSLAPGTDGSSRVARFGVNSVQVSVSDGKSERSAASLVFFLSSGIPDRPAVTIQGVDYDPPGWDVAGEYVLLRSRAPVEVDMTGWTLRDLAGHVFRFPTFALGPSDEVRMFTRAGDNGPDGLFWGRRAAVWNNEGDAVILADGDGREIHRYSYTRRRRR